MKTLDELIEEAFKTYIYMNPFFVQDREEWHYIWTKLLCENLRVVLRNEA